MIEEVHEEVPEEVLSNSQIPIPFDNQYLLSSIIYKKSPHKPQELSNSDLEFLI
jgi:hypothetical protein